MIIQQRKVLFNTFFPFFYIALFKPLSNFVKEIDFVFFHCYNIYRNLKKGVYDYLLLNISYRIKMEKNSIKISLGTVICICIILILLTALGLVYYFGFVKTDNETPTVASNVQDFSLSENNQNISSTQTKKTDVTPNVNAVETIPTTDLVTLYYEATDSGANIFYAYLNNGILNYFIDSKVSNGTSDSTFGFVGSYITSSANTDNMKQYSQLKNIKRLKTYNIGTSVNPTPFLITEDGQVYLLNITSDNNMHINLYEPFKNYKVEDILSATGEMATTFELLLQNGSKESVTVDLD